MSACVTVIIAAYNAADTLSRAIQSALVQPETERVIVVDDASDDATCNVALAAADQDPRVHLIRQAVNQGPAAARNRALDTATSDYVAVLDSDDVFLPGRLGRLLDGPPAELIADNIAFALPQNLAEVRARNWSGIAPGFTRIGAAEFVQGNLRQKGVSRGELGFLKPILSRRFLDRHALRYDPALRLGEDYDLYVRMLLVGARMYLTRQPGYAAVVRPDSLSARHGTDALAQLYTALEAHLKLAEKNGQMATDLSDALQAHLADTRHKRDHRQFLDMRRARGAWPALGFLFGAPDRAWPVACQIVRDKLGLAASAADAAPDQGARLLLPPQPAASGPGA